MIRATPARGATRSRERARLTAQRQVLEAGQHLPKKARGGEALIERQAYGSYADPDPHAELEQLEADRAALRPRQLGAGQAPAPQQLQQRVGEGGEVQAQLVGLARSVCAEVRSANSASCCSLMRFSMSPRAQYTSFYVREVAESRNPDRIREPLFPCRRRRKPPQRPATDASPPSAGRAPGAWPGPRRRRVGPFSSSAFRAVFELGRPVAAIPARPQRKRGYRPASQKDRNAGMSTGP